MNSGMNGNGAELLAWFDLDGELERFAGEAEFLAGLRARAVSRRWPCHPGDTLGFHQRYESGEWLLKVCLGLDDEETSRGLITFGLVFDGKRVVGDRVHDQVYDLEGPTPAAMEFTGPVEFLVDRAGEWFEWLLTWPIERREWFKRGKLTYHEWVVVHTGQKLVVNASRPPAGPPDRVTLVRGLADGPTPLPWTAGRG